MHKKLTIFLTIVFISCFMAPAQSSSELRTELENSMNIVRAALDMQNYEQFKVSIDPTKQSQQLTEEEFNKAVSNEQSLRILTRVIPNFSKETYFLDLVEKNDWAAYYAETNLTDENYLTIAVFVFHKINNKWYYSGISNGLIKARPESEYAKKGYSAWLGMDHIIETIQNDPEFQLENLIKSSEENKVLTD